VGKIHIIVQRGRGLGYVLTPLTLPQKEHLFFTEGVGVEIEAGGGHGGRGDL
jgi:hypothetical protein